MTPCFSETVTQGERDRAMSHLHVTRKMFLDTVTPLSEAQWRFKPAPDRWSVAECAEHITEAETFMRGLIQQTVAKGPADEAKRAERKPNLEKNDAAILAFLADRSKKVQAPEPLKPTGRFASKQEVIDEFKKRRDATIAYIESTPDDLRGRVVNLGGGEMDLYEFVLMISAHSERHIMQMKEVMADPHFPRK